jgi:3-dehydro-4-phosphotetronate decarboxylase
MTESQAREDICRVGASLFARGYVHATAGNISVRLRDEDGGGFLITPTDACLGFLDPARLAKVDAQLNPVSGDPASKTIALHQQIYRASAPTDAPAACIIHTHSTHCVALSLRPDALPRVTVDATTQGQELIGPITPYFVMKVGHVPLVRYHRPGDPAAAALVAKRIAQYAAKGTAIRAVMLERLGPNVWHQSPAAAMATLEELEETARLAVLHAQDHPIDALPEAAIAELRDRFSAVW